MILAPHPDDEALGCSGTLLQLRKKGVYSSIIFLTDGEKLYGAPSSEVARKRREEAMRSADLLGCKESLFLQSPDGEIARCKDMVLRKLRAIVEERKPDVILSPSPIDYHADHIAVASLAVSLLDEFRSFTVAFYEVYSTVRFNCLVDITEVVEGKKRIILNYRTGLWEKPELYIGAALGLNAQRSIFVQKEGFYEAFYLVEGNAELEEIRDYLSYKDVNK